MDCWYALLVLALFGVGEVLVVELVSELMW
jgi:hypothetical protein